MNKYLIATLALSISIACQPGGGGGGPTDPTPNPSATPGSSATPTPTPVTCLPKPPPLDHIGLAIHNHPEADKWIIDSTPKVCDRAYCDSVGFVNRGCCPLRQEGDPLRVVCEIEILGGEGPEWSSPTGNTIFANPSNPWLAVFRGTSGVARACTWYFPKKCYELNVP